MTTKKGHKIYRKLRFHYLKLVRLKATPSFIARGYALGILIEFITLPTLGLAFILLYPLTVLLRSSFAASLIGFVTGKFIMFFFLYWNYYVGNLLVGKNVSEKLEENISHFISIDMLREKGFAFFVGSAINGTIVALISFIIIYYVLVLYRKRQAIKRNQSPPLL